MRSLARGDKRDFYQGLKQVLPLWADGPDEVHLQSIARIEIKNSAKTLGATAAYLTPPLR